MNKKKNKPSDKVVEDSLKVAKATQKPGQTKEQTKLIAQGVQKGIEEYKKQQKQKARELDKKLKKVRSQADANALSANSENDSVEPAKSTARLPWALLFGSWILFIVYFFTQQPS